MHHRSTYPLAFVVRLGLSLLLCAGAARAAEPSPQSDLDRAIQELDQPAEQPSPGPSADASAEPAAPAPQQAGGPQVRLLDLSLDALISAGGSTLSDDLLQQIQGGGHDPRKRGFTIQNIELTLIGAVDPYLTGQANVIFQISPLDGETIVELEEAFLTTQALPWGLQIKAGQFFNEFGRLNRQHPHQWHWQDLPVINSRIFGGDGLRGPGLRVSWLTPLPWFSQLYLGAHNANGETLRSFLANEAALTERPIAGRPFVARSVRNLKDLLYMARWENFWDVGDEVGVLLGASALFGPNASGPQGRTRVYGADLFLKWRPANNERGWPFLSWQTEFIRRDFQADAFFDASDPAKVISLPAETIEDSGLYSELLYGFVKDWAAGIRYEYATGNDDSSGTRAADPLRTDRHRISPLIVFHPSHFSRLRLQYNYDLDANLPNGNAHSLWLGVEIGFGAHAAHAY